MAGEREGARRTDRGRRIMALTTKSFDAAEYLDDDEAVAAYLDEAMATGDRQFIAKSIGVVARARGMTQIAKDTGLSRESLYRALGDEGNPTLGTLMDVLAAFGLRLSVSTGAADKS
jgi:probable addiction module antidote protein